jgi:disulfide bond formation protein DsbB
MLKLERKKGGSMNNTFIKNLFGHLIKYFFYYLSGLSFSGIIGAHGLEILLALEPCNLCLLQRFCLWLLGISSLIAAFASSKACSLLKSLNLAMCYLSISAGILFSSRQVWLEQLPFEQKPPCTPGLDYLLNNFSLLESLGKIFLGSGECGTIEWQFLGFSLAFWSLCFFSLLLLILLSYSLLSRNKIFQFTRRQI